MTGQPPTFVTSADGTRLAVGQKTVQVRHWWRCTEPPPTTRGGRESQREGRREYALLHFFRAVVRVPQRELEVLKTQSVWPARIAAAHTIAREAAQEESYNLDLERFRALRVPTLLLLGGESPATFQRSGHIARSISTA